MICAWHELLSILSQTIRQEVDKQGKDSAQEIRLRLGKSVEIVQGTGSTWIQHTVQSEDLKFVVNTASRYSPWAAATSAYGYLTARGGHRIGLCGECIISNGEMTGVRNLTSVCIRVARDFVGIADCIPVLLGNCLILGPPNSGKTTLLRDLIRKVSERESICVIDERGELFPVSGCFSTGKRTDILSGCRKPQGIETAMRTMGPSWIAVDEVTASADCDAMLQACWCGVRLIATAHASSKEDLLHRSVYRPLAESGIFDTLVILQRDKSWKMERMK